LKLTLRPLLVVFLVALSGCASNRVDTSVELTISGRVIDTTERGIDDVKIRFRDISLERPVLSGRSDLLVGQTDDGGRMTAEFFYLWGEYSSRPRSGERCFDLVFSKNGWKTDTMSFCLESLPSANGRPFVEFLVELGKQGKE